MNVVSSPSGWTARHLEDEIPAFGDHVVRHDGMFDQVLIERQTLDIFMFVRSRGRYD